MDAEPSAPVPAGAESWPARAVEPEVVEVVEEVRTAAAATSPAATSSTAPVSQAGAPAWVEVERMQSFERGADANDAASASSAAPASSTTTFGGGGRAQQQPQRPPSRRQTNEDRAVQATLRELMALSEDLEGREPAKDPEDDFWDTSDSDGEDDFHWDALWHSSELRWMSTASAPVLHL